MVKLPVYTSETLENVNYKENFTDVSGKFVRIMEVIALQRLKLWKAKYNRLLKNFHGDFAFDSIMKVFELRRFKLERLYSKRMYSCDSLNK